jgi:hypothetical protein
VFTVAEAAEHGLSRRVLQGKRFTTVFPGVFRYVDTPLTFELGVAAAVRHLTPGFAFSHLTNLRLRGLAMRDEWPIAAAVHSWSRPQHDDLLVHRYIGTLEIEQVAGLPLLTPVRTFVDCGTLLSVRELVEVGDWMVQRGLATIEGLHDYATRVHLDGVQRARKAALLVRAGSESPRESGLRVTLVTAGLPEPEINTDIVDADGRFLARGDLVYRAQRLIVEYDGWYHERDAEQRQKDILRRERLEAAGWRLLVVTALDMSRPDEVVARVRRALASRDMAA